MKKWLCLLLAVGLVFALAACGKEETAKPKPSKEPAQKEAVADVGICMPSEDPYWAEGAKALEEDLVSRGLTVKLFYAQDQVQTQVDQVKELVEGHVGCLVIGAVDSVALTAVEQQAKEARIPLVAYDRLLMDTDAVSLYVGFDYIQMGEDLAQNIEDTRQLKTAADQGRSYTIEFFMGSADDNNAVLLHTGIFHVLQPYLDSGVLACRTGRVSMEDSCILRWDSQEARNRCAVYLAEQYPKADLDIICAASDSLAAGCLEALAALGGEAKPTVTGQGGDQAAQERVAAGAQAVTFQKDPKTLAAACAQAVALLVEGESVEAENVTNNHLVDVPAIWCDWTVLEAPVEKTE